MQIKCNVRSIFTRGQIFDRPANGGALASCSQDTSWLVSQCAFTTQIRENRISSRASTGLAWIHQSRGVSRSSVAMTVAPAIDQLELRISILINPCHAWPLYCQLGSGGFGPQEKFGFLFQHHFNYSAVQLTVSVSPNPSNTSKTV